MRGCAKNLVSSGRIHIFLASLLLLLGTTTPVAESAQSANQNLFMDWWLLLKRSHLERDSGRLIEAKAAAYKALVKAEAMGAESPLVIVTLAELVDLVPETKVAEHLLDRQESLEIKLGAKFPGLAPLYFRRAEIKVRESQWQEASLWFENALKIEPAFSRGTGINKLDTLSNLAAIYEIQNESALRDGAIRRYRMQCSKYKSFSNQAVLRGLAAQFGYYSDLLSSATDKTFVNNTNAIHRLRETQRKLLASADQEQVSRVTYKVHVPAPAAVGFDLITAKREQAQREFVDLYKQAHTCNEKKQYAEAESLYRRTIEMESKTNGTGTLAGAILLKELADTYYMDGKYGQAEPVYNDALATYQKAAPANDPNVGLYVTGLARCYVMQGKTAQAAPLLDRVKTIYSSPSRKDLSITAIRNDLQFTVDVLAARNLKQDAQELEAFTQQRFALPAKSR